MIKSFVKHSYEDSVLLIANRQPSLNDVEVFPFARDNGSAMRVYHFFVYLDFTYGFDFS
jgi:hypothetical protein